MRRRVRRRATTPNHPLIFETRFGAPTPTQETCYLVESPGFLRSNVYVTIKWDVAGRRWTPCNQMQVVYNYCKQPDLRYISMLPIAIIVIWIKTNVAITYFQLWMTNICGQRFNIRIPLKTNTDSWWVNENRFRLLGLFDWSRITTSVTNQ